MSAPKEIAVIGAGHVGAPHAIMIAKKCPDVKVTIVDDDEPDQTELESAVAELEQQIAEANALGEETGPVEKILEEVRLELESVRSRKGPR